MKMEHNTSLHSSHSPNYSPNNISLSTSPNNFPAMLEPLDSVDQAHMMMNYHNNNNNNGINDDMDDHSMDNDFNSLDINKTKFQSFGIYIGNELCSLRNELAEELHERLLTELLKFKREVRKTNCVEM